MTIRHLKTWFPSWRISLVGIGLGFSVGYFLAYAEDTDASANVLIWHLVHRLGHWWWLPLVIISVLALYYMARLDRATTTTGKVARMCHLVGFLFYICAAFGVNGLGILASILVAMGTLLMIRQIAHSCIAKRAARRPEFDLPFGLRLLLTLVDHRP